MAEDPTSSTPPQSINGSQDSESAPLPNAAVTDDFDPKVGSSRVRFSETDVDRPIPTTELPSRLSSGSVIRRAFRRLNFSKKVRGIILQNLFHFWHVFAFVVICYDFFMITFRSFFFISDYEWIASDVLCDIVLWIDFFIHLFNPLATTAVNVSAEDAGLKETLGAAGGDHAGSFMANDAEDHRSFKERFVSFLRSTRRHFSVYFHKGWWTDFLACIPLEWVAYGVLPEYHVFFKLNRSIKLIYFMFYLTAFQRIAGLVLRQEIPTAYLHLARSIFITVIAAHLMACGYFAVLYFQKDATSPSFFVGEIDLLTLTPSQQYIRSFFWAFVSMTGYGNTQPVTTLETLCSMIVAAVGLALYITIIGTVGSLVSNLDAVGREFQTRMDELNAFMNFRELPTRLRQQIIMYYDYLWKSRKSFDESKVLRDLPVRIRMNVSLERTQEILASVDLFAGCSMQFRESIAVALKPCMALPNVLVVMEGDIGREMILLVSGCFHVVDARGEILRELRQGSFFGEAALVRRCTRVVSLKSASYCDFYKLHRADFEKAASHFPDDRERIDRNMELLQTSSMMRGSLILKDQSMPQDDDEGEDF